MIGHVPVLVEETEGLLMPERVGVFLDATVGLGGHAEHMIRKMPPDGLFIGIDRDEEALRAARARLEPFGPRVIIKKGRFSEIKEALDSLDIKGVDGALFDLGVSMLQLKEQERGFSFSSDEPLDMRMDREQELTAEKAVNEWPEAELARIIWEYGEERHSRKIARAIVNARRERRIKTGRELASIVSRFYRGWHRIHPATRTFQALRIAVNNEMEELPAGLRGAADALNPGGRMAVISYHSLEDRIVKHFFRDEEREGKLKVLTKKPVVSSPEETAANPAARSAKLRAAERAI